MDDNFLDNFNPVLGLIRQEGEAILSRIRISYDLSAACRKILRSWVAYDGAVRRGASPSNERYYRQRIMGNDYDIYGVSLRPCESGGFPSTGKELMITWVYQEEDDSFSFVDSTIPVCWIFQQMDNS